MVGMLDGVKDRPAALLRPWTTWVSYLSFSEYICIMYIHTLYRLLMGALAVHFCRCYRL